MPLCACERASVWERHPQQAPRLYTGALALRLRPRVSSRHASRSGALGWGHEGAAGAGSRCANGRKHLSASPGARTPVPCASASRRGVERDEEPAGCRHAKARIIVISCSFRPDRRHAGLRTLSARSSILEPPGSTGFRPKGLWTVPTIWSSGPVTPDLKRLGPDLSAAVPGRTSRGEYLDSGSSSAACGLPCTLRLSEACSGSGHETRKTEARWRDGEQES